MVSATPTELLRWIVILPALGFLWNLFFGRRLPGSVKIVGPGVLLAAFAVAVTAVLQLHGMEHGASLRDHVFTWIDVGAFKAEAALRVDPLSSIMILVITGIGFLIHVYSVGYMAHDHDTPRFFTYLNLFVTAMLILVLGDNLLLLFVGWEGVGLCSYLLIGFWYDNMDNAVAGKKAFIVNRIGDAGFLIGMFLLVQSAGTLDVVELQHQVQSLGADTVGDWPLPTVVCLLFFLGATGKSAQIPLYVWLPDAMAGPTPVSALIHAATMVTAGIYMMARMHFLFALAPDALTVIATIGALTALVSALIAMTQTDIKKVLAYSTVSQLGYMVLGIGSGVTGAAMFHVVTHAFFKGLLFLGAGSVIHAMSGEQDMRKMGALRTHLPVTFWTMLIGTLAISGIPPLSGFFSKDEIIWGAFHGGSHAIPILGVIGYVVAFLTAFYMGRLLLLTFFGESRVDDHAMHHLHESPAVMTLPLVVLAILSAVGGFIPIPAIVDIVTGSHGHDHAPLWALLLAMTLAFGGLGLAWFCYIAQPGIPDRVASSLGGLYALVRDKFRIDELYDLVVVRPLFVLADILASIVDRGIIDGIVNGSGGAVRAASRSWRRLQTGNVQHYALSFLVGALALVYYITR